MLVISIICCYNSGQRMKSNRRAVAPILAIWNDEVCMASKKGNRIVIKLRSTESGHMYITMKNRKNDPNRLELRRYDPTLRRHVTYRETK